MHLVYMFLKFGLKFDTLLQCMQSEILQEIIIKVITMLMSHLPMLNVDGIIVSNEQWKLCYVSDRINTVYVCFHFLTTGILIIRIKVMLQLHYVSADYRYCNMYTKLLVKNVNLKSSNDTL